MIIGQEVQRIPKSAFDALCPYCKSRAVYLVSSHRGEVNDPATPGTARRHGVYIEEWSCAICYRSFELY
jgi:hypothetical protein